MITSLLYLTTTKGTHAKSRPKAREHQLYKVETVASLLPSKLKGQTYRTLTRLPGSKIENPFGALRACKIFDCVLTNDFAGWLPRLLSRELTALSCISLSSLQKCSRSQHRSTKSQSHGYQSKARDWNNDAFTSDFECGKVCKLKSSLNVLGATAMLLTSDIQSDDQQASVPHKSTLLTAESAG